MIVEGSDLWRLRKYQQAFGALVEAASYVERPLVSDSLSKVERHLLRLPVVHQACNLLHLRAKK